MKTLFRNSWKIAPVLLVLLFAGSADKSNAQPLNCPVLIVLAPAGVAASATRRIVRVAIVVEFKTDPPISMAFYARVVPGHTRSTHGERIEVRINDCTGNA